MSEVPEPIRREAATLARRRRARFVQFSPEAPTDWRPGTVVNPEDGMPFTRSGAWEFVATKLEDRDQSVEWVELHSPRGARALVMLVPQGDRKIYIKVQMGAGKIYGRSFHYSDR